MRFDHDHEYDHEYEYEYVFGRGSDPRGVVMMRTGIAWSFREL